MLRTPLLAALILTSTACTFRNDALRSRLGRPLEELPPIPYRIGIAPVNYAEAMPSPGRPKPTKLYQGKPLTWDLGRNKKGVERTIQDELPALLGARLRTASQVVALGNWEARKSNRNESAAERDEKNQAYYRDWRDKLMANAREARVDLVIIPILKEEPFLDRGGLTKKAWTAFGLWITTWWAGLNVEDRDYHTRVKYEFQIWDPLQCDAAIVEPVSASVEKTPLRFRDRQHQHTVGWIMGAVVPPFWTVPKRTSVQRSLSKKMCLTLAGTLAQYLKEDFVSENLGVRGRLDVVHAPTDSEPFLRVRIVCMKRRELAEFRVQVGGHKPVPVEIGRSFVRRGLNYISIRDIRVEPVRERVSVRAWFRFKDEPSETRHWRTLIFSESK